MRCAESLRVHAYFDNELDVAAIVSIEQHLQHCGECRALLQELEQTRAELKKGLTNFQATPQLRARIDAALNQEQAVELTSRQRSVAATRSRPFWLGAFAGTGITTVAAALVLFFLMPTGTNPVVNDVFNAHVRSLISNHLIDVVSTDKHTVKPWFAGHTDVSPVVADFESQGYRLIGGRVDYIERQRSAVVVYQHGPHVINVFSWAGNQQSLPKDTTRNGYHLSFWHAGDLEYCAVSDMAWDELHILKQLLQNLSTDDGRR